MIFSMKEIKGTFSLIFMESTITVPDDRNDSQLIGIKMQKQINRVIPANYTIL